MSSSFIKVREESAKKRAKELQELRLRVATSALSGLLTNGSSPTAAAHNALRAADLLLRSLGYIRSEVEPSPLTEEEQNFIDED